MKFAGSRLGLSPSKVYLTKDQKLAPLIEPEYRDNEKIEIESTTIHDFIGGSKNGTFPYQGFRFFSFDIYIFRKSDALGLLRQGLGKSWIRPWTFKAAVLDWSRENH